MKNNLKIAAFINFFMAAVFLTTGAMSIIPMLFVIFSAFFILEVVNKDEIEEKKTILTVIGFVSLIFSPISGVIILWNINNVKKAEVVKPQIDPEAKRIDIILKLGVFMVLVSGLMFATSSWEAIDDIFKFIGLIVLSLLFFGLSKFSEDKLKIESTTNMYWYLSMAFILFALVSAFYFQLLGTYLSFEGEGLRLVFSILFLTFGFLSHLTNIKFKKPELKMLTYAALYLAIDSALIHFLEVDFRLLALSFIIGALYLFKRDDNHLNYVLNFVALIILPFTYMANVSGVANVYTYALVLIPIILNMIYATLKEDNKIFNVTTPILIGLLVNSIVLSFDNILIYNYVLIVLIMAAIYIASIFVNYKDDVKRNMMIVANVFMFTSIIVLPGNENIANPELMTLAMAGLFLITDLINITYKKGDVAKVEKFIQPLKVVLFTVALYNYVISIFTINSYMVNDFIYIILFLIYVLNKDSLSKNIYRFALYFTLLVTAFIYAFSNQDIMSMLLLMLVSGLQFLYTYRYENKKEYLSISYTLFLMALFSQLIVGNIFELGHTVSSLIVINIYVILMLIFRKEKGIFTVSALALALPLNVLIGDVTESGDLYIMLTRLLAIYVIFIFNKFIIKEQDKKQVFTLVTLSLVVLSMIFTSSLLIGLFTGLIGLIVMLLGYYNKEYTKLFALGIVITVLNILYQLRDLWNKVPFWLYLLVVGLLLIGFVTKKELKRLENKDNEIDN